MTLITSCNENQPDDIETVPITETGDAKAGSPMASPTNEPEAPPPTPIPPTPTPQLAALVNGQPILLEDFEKELARYELAQADMGEEPNADNGRQQVLDALVERELVRQAAVVQGLNISDEVVDGKLRDLQESGSDLGSFDEWLIANQWTLEEFRAALAAEMLVEEMIAVVTADVPQAMEQVRARYIQVDDLNLAQSIAAQLDEGGDFSTLAQQYSLDQATAPYGGDLGYFARGSLLVPAVEIAAFNLQVDEVSDIISVVDEDSSLTTYYILQLIERDPDRMLGADLRHRLLQESFESWLDEQKSGATITYLLDN